MFPAVITKSPGRIGDKNEPPGRAKERKKKKKKGGGRAPRWSGDGEPALQFFVTGILILPLVWALLFFWLENKNH